MYVLKFRFSAYSCDQKSEYLFNNQLFFEPCSLELLTAPENGNSIVLPPVAVQNLPLFGGFQTPSVVSRNSIVHPWQPQTNAEDDLAVSCKMAFLDFISMFHKVVW